MLPISPASLLPSDLANATLIGRIWRGGPCVVAVRGGEVFDITAAVPTVSELLERDNPLEIARQAPGESLGAVQELLAQALQAPNDQPLLLAPCDLQAVKACGVTFAVSLLERVIEEQAGGNADKAAALRGALQATLGSDLSALKPGSDAAQRLKAQLQERGAWSQYMEVGIGPDAEVFTKAQPMSSVGCGAQVGLLPASAWNNPEPEIVLAVNSRGQVLGATLGNDVNLRDIEGRSALLLGKAKDNNGSCAIGPFIRLFDASFGIDDVRACELTLRVQGPEGFELAGSSSMRLISRDPLDLAAQVIGPNHQYPDGVVLFLGTMFAPSQDRHGPGQGFTHVVGDVVTVSTPKLGTLVNRVRHCDQVAPWTFGITALMGNLASRGLLSA